VDIGGVMLSDGWGHESRALAAKTFGLDLKEMETRHNQVFGTCELDKLTFEEYLKRAVFYEKRDFTLAEFKRFIFMRSRPYLPMIDLVRKLKARYGLKIVVVSNEVRELNLYRIKKFKLDKFVDSFISSCFVHLRKPDADIFRLALDIAQVPVEQIVYIENTPMFVKVAQSLGIESICHTDYKMTRAKLASFGLEI
jgi:putative hydrolase of the HAD superfamily